MVGPAGGETGGPHCLAEVYKLLKSSIDSKYKDKNSSTIALRDDRGS